MKKTLLGIIACILLFSQSTYSVFFHEKEKHEKYDKTFLISMCTCASRALDFDKNSLYKFSTGKLIMQYKHIMYRISFIKKVINECTHYNKTLLHDDIYIQEQEINLHIIHSNFLDLANKIKMEYQEHIQTMTNSVIRRILNFSQLKEKNLAFLKRYRKFIFSLIHTSEKYQNLYLLWMSLVNDSCFHDEYTKINKSLLFYTTKALPFIEKLIYQKQNVEQSQNLQQTELLPTKFAQ